MVKVMEEELEFLEYLHNIIKLEKDALSRIIKMREKIDILNNILKEQIEVYKKFSVSVERMIKVRRKKVNDLSLFAKMASHVGAKFVVSNDNDDELICSLLRRYKICIEEIENKFRDSKIKSKTISNLFKRFIEFENRNIDIIYRTYPNVNNENM